MLWFCSKVLPRLLSQVVSLSLIVVGKGDPGEELSNALKTDGVIYYGEVIDVKEY